MLAAAICMYCLAWSLTTFFLAEIAKDKGVDYAPYIACMIVACYWPVIAGYLLFVKGKRYYENW